MKAIYINFDPYLAAFAAWIKGGKSGDAPTFNPLPLAVTIPLGESAAIYLPTEGKSEEDQTWNPVTVDGVPLNFGVTSVPWESVVASEIVPGLSALAPDAKYAVAPFGGGSVSITIFDEEEYEYEIPFTVIVNRETASGPVDLVDFTPPAALTADAINAALGGSGAEDGAPLKGVKLVEADIRGAALGASYYITEDIQEAMASPSGTFYAIALDEE